MDILGGSGSVLWVLLVGPPVLEVNERSNDNFITVWKHLI